ncbi:TRAP transporter small permease [Caminibacter mediatlanticus TB-2]|uniref:Small integral c4-dicarboxylate membrane transport protein,putative n=1 Tax=Caminibacter mediatlanticus TB-2 TaxID=391592 RepID=A0AAI9AHA3_9BACT|nr:TRAP transporter small permease [Caminibacter mediatlanticus]EDM23489.1 small integral c4-dicarboxylate membrane transport protein,putative [Caminibacter mediatlanticus TB-2]QCT94062.1 TRAP transporter small permease [Caminibacter mediatlanticus TB-2]
MKYIDLFIRGILVFLTSFFIFAGVVLAFVNVVARFIFNEGIDWAFELTSYLFIYSAFFAAAYLFRVSGHIKVTLLVDNLPKSLSKLVIIISDILILLYLGIILYFGYIYIFDPELGLKASGEVSVDLNVPMWTIYLVIPISMFFAIIMTIFRLIEHIKTPASEIAYKEEHDMIKEFDKSVGDGK